MNFLWFNCLPRPSIVPFWLCVGLVRRVIGALLPALGAIFALEAREEARHAGAGGLANRCMRMEER